MVLTDHCIFLKKFSKRSFLKELFGKNVEESLIAADFKVLKSGNKTDFIFNPLSILTPGKLETFLIYGSSYYNTLILSPTDK